MPQFITAHVITCMTRQDLKRLVEGFQKASDPESVQLEQARADTMSGRMLCTWQANAKDDVVSFLEDQNIKFRGSEEWIMQVQLESGPEGLKPPQAS